MRGPSELLSVVFGVAVGSARLLAGAGGSRTRRRSVGRGRRGSRPQHRLCGPHAYGAVDGVARARAILAATNATCASMAENSRRASTPRASASDWTPRSRRGPASATRQNQQHRSLGPACCLGRDQRVSSDTWKILASAGLSESAPRGVEMVGGAADVRPPQMRSRRRRSRTRIRRQGSRSRTCRPPVPSQPARSIPSRLGSVGREAREHRRAVVKAQPIGQFGPLPRSRSMGHCGHARDTFGGSPGC